MIANKECWLEAVGEMSLQPFDSPVCSNTSQTLLSHLSPFQPRRRGTGHLLFATHQPPPTKVLQPQSPCLVLRQLLLPLLTFTCTPHAIGEEGNNVGQTVQMQLICLSVF